MLEIVRTFLLTFCLLLILLFMIQYEKSLTDYRQGPFHRAGNLLLYVYLKTCLTMAYGRKYIKLKMKNIFCNYHPEDDHLKEISRRKEQIDQLHRQMTLYGNDYYKKINNHLKII